MSEHSMRPEEFLPELLELAGDYLVPNGWFESVRQQRSVDCQGPVPWLTYPAIEALKRVEFAGQCVFEYGAGNSSLWWASRGCEVTSVEHDPGWRRFLAAPLSDRNQVEVIERGTAVPKAVSEWLEPAFFAAGLDPEPHYRHGPSPSVACRGFEAYACHLLRFPPGHFQVIVIDGAARVLCAWLAAQNLAEDGLIVFDNTDRVVYSNGYAELAKRGFARIDFWGPSPMNRYESCTSIFTRTLAPFLPQQRAAVEPRPEHFWR